MELQLKLNDGTETEHQGVITDGFTSEFYKFFGMKLITPLIKISCHCVKIEAQPHLYLRGTKLPMFLTTYAQLHW